MFQAVRANSNNADFQKLVIELDKYLANVNGDENDFFVQFNQLDLIKHVVLIYDHDKAVGCSAMKEYETGVMEIKRMFVPLEHRRKGIAKTMLNELQSWAKELGYKKCILETANSMKDAVDLYSNYGFIQIPNYGQYANVETSVCFEKVINL